MKGNHNFFLVFILSAIFFAGTIFVITEVYAEEHQNKIEREINIPSNNIEIQTTQKKYNKLAVAAFRDSKVSF